MVADLSVVKDDLDVPVVEDSDCLFLPLNELWADPPSSCPLVAIPVHSLVAFYPFDVDIIPSVQDYGNVQQQHQRQGVLVSRPPAGRSSPPSADYWTKSPELGYQSSASKSKALSGSGSEDTLVQNQEPSEWENLPPVENPKAKRLLSTKLPLRPVLGAKSQGVQMSRNEDVSMSTDDRPEKKNNEDSDVNDKKRLKEKRSISKSKGGKKKVSASGAPWCENAELLDLLSGNQSDSSLFKQVYDILRTYGWSYRYSGLAVLFLKPHAVKQKVVDLVLGKDAFDSEEALLEGLCQEMDIPYLREAGSRKPRGKDLHGDLLILSSRGSAKPSYQRPPRLTAKKKILGDTNIKALERRRSNREKAKASLKNSLSGHQSQTEPDFSSLSESSPFEKIETSGDDSPAKGNCSSSSGYFEDSSRTREAKEVKRRLFSDEKPAKKKKKSSNVKNSQQQEARNKRSHKRKSKENEDEEEEMDDEILSSQSSTVQHDSDSESSPRPAKKAKSVSKMVDIGRESALLCPPASAYQGDLRAYIQSMISHMEDDTYFNTHLPFPVPGRVDETIYLFNHIMHSLRIGKGKMIYIAGHPGGGKSQTVEITLLFLNRLFNKHHPPKQSPIGEGVITTGNHSHATKKASRFGSSTIPSDSETTTASSKARSFSRFINVQEENDHHFFHIIRANAMRLDGMNTLKQDLNAVCNLFSEEECTADRLRDHFVEFPAHDCELPWTSLEVDYQHYLGLNMFSQNIKRHLPPTSSLHRLPPNFTSNRSADILNIAEEVKGKRKEKYRTYPMVILFIDEIDKLSGKVYDKLFEMTKGRLIVVGTGNTVHSILPDDASLIAMATGSVDDPKDSGVVLNPSSFQYSSAVRVCSMIFNPYEVSDFEAILAFRAGDFFSAKALELLAKKIKQRGNGDLA